jgi:hypothetical protein
MDSHLEHFGDTVDRLITTGIGKLSHETLHQGVIQSVYEEARSQYGRSLSLMAAERLIDSVEPDDNVLILTNSIEMDGPPGATALARAINIALDAKTIIITNVDSHPLIPYEERVRRVVPETCIAAGLMPVEYELLRKRAHRVHVHHFPSESVENSKRLARELLDMFEPSAIITSEALGRNEKGVYHTAMGYASVEGLTSDDRADRMDYILEVVVDRGIPSISLGDNGNEMGFAGIADAWRHHHPYGARCRCPCGSGIVSTTKSDIAIPATTSNWGCYGVEACLARLREDAEIMHDGEDERRILHACADVGVPDGATVWCTPTVDGTPHLASVYVVELLRMTVSQSLRTLHRPW